MELCSPGCPAPNTASQFEVKSRMAKRNTVYWDDGGSRPGGREGEDEVGKEVQQCLGDQLYPVREEVLGSSCSAVEMLVSGAGDIEILHIQGSHPLLAAGSQQDPCPHRQLQLCTPLPL